MRYIVSLTLLLCVGCADRSAGGCASQELAGRIALARNDGVSPADKVEVLAGRTKDMVYTPVDDSAPLYNLIADYREYVSNPKRLYLSPSEWVELQRLAILVDTVDVRLVVNMPEKPVSEKKADTERSITEEQITRLIRLLNKMMGN